jgi:hypothetical protein
VFILRRDAGEIFSIPGASSFILFFNSPKPSKTLQKPPKSQSCPEFGMHAGARVAPPLDWTGLDWIGLTSEFACGARRSLELCGAGMRSPHWNFSSSPVFFIFRFFPDLSTKHKRGKTYGNVFGNKLGSETYE